MIGPGTQAFDCELGEASHRHSYAVGSLEKDVLHVYRKLVFVVVEENGEAPK